MPILYIHTITFSLDGWCLQYGDDEDTMMIIIHGLCLQYGDDEDTMMMIIHGITMDR